MRSAAVATKLNKPQVIQPRVAVNNGKDIARLVREADPDGAVTEHHRVTSGRMIDLVYEQGQIAPLQYQAGTMLRNAFERSRVSMNRLGSVDPGAIGGSSSVDFIRRIDGVTVEDAEGDEDSLAWKAYERAMRQTGQWWPILRSVVIEDKHPSIYGAMHRCHGYTELKAALDALARHFGLVARRRG